MDFKNIIPITTARKRFFDILEEAEKKKAHFVLTKFGKPYAVIISIEEFKRLTQYKV